MRGSWPTSAKLSASTICKTIRRPISIAVSHPHPCSTCYDSDPESGKIFITGGNGIVGHRVAQRLLNAGYPEVRLGAHKADSLEDFNKLGAEIAEFGWNKEETYESALKGVKSVLCTIPYTRGWQYHFPAFLEACRKAGVKHYIKISFYHATVLDDPFQAVPLVREHGKCDQQLMDLVKPLVEITPAMAADADVAIDFRSTNMSYTILYASHFMSNPFIFQGTELRDSAKLSTFYGASANHGVNYVSPNDVAEVVVRCLLEPCAHYDKEYTLTGPSAITDNQVASMLSKYLKKSVMYVDQPLKEYSIEIKLSGDPKWMVEDLVALEKIKATGKEEDPSFASKDIENICGHAPESFEDYLRMTDMMIPVEAGPPSELVPLKASISV